MDRPFKATAEGNVPFTDEEFAQWQIDQAAAAKPVVPQEVSMVQARLALVKAGLYDKVNSTIASFPASDTIHIEWEFRTSVRRDSQLVASLAPTLGLSDAQLDQLFTLAAGM